MTLFLRILAQAVDLVVSLFLLVFSFLVILPALCSLLPGVPETVWAVAVLLLAVALMVLVQLPFLAVHQTAGKAFFGLRIVSTNPDRPLTTSILFQREVFGKLLSCYLICLPALFGKEGGHDRAAETRVVRTRREPVHE